MNKLRGEKNIDEAEKALADSAKLKVESDIAAYMEARWKHYMKQPQEDLRNGYLNGSEPG